jgi:hypothetical protein
MLGSARPGRAPAAPRALPHTNGGRLARPPPSRQLPLPSGMIEDITLGGTSLLDAEHLDPHFLDKYFTLGDHPIRVAGMKVGLRGWGVGVGGWGVGAGVGLRGLAESDPARAGAVLRFKKGRRPLVVGVPQGRANQLPPAVQPRPDPVAGRRQRGEAPRETARGQLEARAHLVHQDVVLAQVSVDEAAALVQRAQDGHHLAVRGAQPLQRQAGVLAGRGGGVAAAVRAIERQEQCKRLAGRPHPT